MKDDTYIMVFGKFKGYTLKEILLHQPTYLLWLDNNTNIKLTEELKQRAINMTRRPAYNSPIDNIISHDIYN